MTKHLLKLVWHRKRANALIITEILFSFLVVVVVITGALYLWSNYTRPLGFDYQNVWQVSMDVHQTTNDEWTPEQADQFARVLQEARAMPEVVSAAGVQSTPFDFSTSDSAWDQGGRELRSEVNEVTDDFASTMKIHLTSGRWFESSDDALNWEPVVINQRLARDAYGSENPLGRRLGEEDSKHDRRVVGVVDDFRRSGELSAPVNYTFRRVRVGDPSSRPPRNLVVRIRPGTPASFEPRLIERLSRVAPDWTFQMKPLADIRASRMRLALTPIAAGALVAFFLLLMVGLGLIGVLWQNVIQRTQEIGLRRAIGASRGAIHRQVVTELLIVTFLGVTIGTLLVVQVPLLDLFGFLDGQILAGGLIIAILLVVGLSVACALYPSWMASRIEPASALHYE